jgi:cobalt-zinc-cadmium efflux system outer membrane protein
MKNRLIIILVSLAIVLCNTVRAQIVLTEQQVLDSAVKASPLVISAELRVKQSRQLQKTTYNFSNPDLIAESPTGDFYAIGVLQSVNFPTYYLKQGQLLKQQTILSEKEREITQNDVKRFIRNLYLDLQFSQALSLSLRAQDSLFAKISQSAARQFEAGQIDYLAKMFAQAQYGEVHSKFVQSEADVRRAQNQLQFYASLHQPMQVTPIKKNNHNSRVGIVVSQDSLLISSAPSVQFWQQQQVVSRKSLQLEKQKALPGLVVGYLNQGPKSTPANYRFRVGITVPVWFWQYSGNIRAARTGLLITDQKMLAQRQSFISEFGLASYDHAKFDATLNYYENQGLNQADEIIKTSGRLFDSGQIDHITLLRNMNDAFNIKIQYLETLRKFNQSVIDIQYLTGKP